MKKEIDDGNVTQLKLKNPFYRLDYLKEYEFRHKKKIVLKYIMILLKNMVI